MLWYELIGPYFSIINVYLEDINVFARFDEIPTLLVENIKEEPKCHRRTERRADRKQYTPPQTQFAGDIIE